MEKKKASLSCQQARQMDMVLYLSGLGHEPARVNRSDHWYLSPLRVEKTPSFKINRARNHWYDFGSGQGGNLVDFGILYFKCTVGEFLLKLENSFPPIAMDYVNRGNKAQHHTIAIVAEQELSSQALLRYLAERCIPVELAKRYCREVRYSIAGKTYYGIGFKNNSGGYELRNPFFKSASSPKDVTTILHGGSAIAVFEGFFDFLSYLVLCGHGQTGIPDFLILNSLAFFEKARPVMESYASVQLYLDRDAAGQHTTSHALSLGKQYKDQSSLYRDHKDFNEYLCKSSRTPDHGSGLGPGL